MSAGGGEPRYYEWQINRIRCPTGSLEWSVISAMSPVMSRPAWPWKAADRQKNEFLAMLAHELRNPLAPIRNAGEILPRTCLSIRPGQRWWRWRTPGIPTHSAGGRSARCIPNYAGSGESQLSPSSSVASSARPSRPPSPCFRRGGTRFRSSSVTAHLYVNGDMARLVPCWSTF